MSWINLNSRAAMCGLPLPAVYGLWGLRLRDALAGSFYSFNCKRRLFPAAGQWDLYILLLLWITVRLNHHSESTNQSESSHPGSKAVQKTTCTPCNMTLMSTNTCDLRHSTIGGMISCIQKPLPFKCTIIYIIFLLNHDKIAYNSSATSMSLNVPFSTRERWV